MREPVFSGACTAIVTPFEESGAVNYDAFGTLIEEQIEAGIDAICVCGTTGESATMSIREHIAVELAKRALAESVKLAGGELA